MRSELRRAIRPVLALGALATATLVGCSALTLDEVATDAPRFDFEAHFAGHTRASGWFADRSGAPQRHFCGDFVGSREDDEFVLDETLFYTDGIVETRVWRVTIDDEGNFRASGDSLVGDALGELSGNGLRMRYSMNVTVAEGEDYELDFNDFMLLQPDGSVHNITQVKKFGIRLGTVSTQYVRHDGGEHCQALIDRIAADG